jgi:hypothetical protein
VAHFETVRVARELNAVAWQLPSACVVFRGICGGAAILLTAEIPCRPQERYLSIGATN